MSRFYCKLRQLFKLSGRCGVGCHDAMLVADWVNENGDEAHAFEAGPGWAWPVISIARRLLGAHAQISN
jgi:hypothetical protein